MVVRDLSVLQCKNKAIHADRHAVPWVMLNALVAAGDLIRSSAKRRNSMTISSRTPEGQPNSCPICKARVVIEPSILFGDATCPHCGHLLWFVQSANIATFFDGVETASMKNRVLDFLADQLGIARDAIANNPRIMDDIGNDSLDTVKIVMALEEEFDV